MEADYRREGVEEVGEPCIELVRGGGDWGRRDKEVFNWYLQVFPVGFIPHGSGGARLSDGVGRWMRMGTGSDPV